MHAAQTAPIAEPGLAGTNNTRIIILGTGPTGLGAGYRLQELGHENFVLYEKNNYVGGLSHSFTDDKGFTWDIGGHVMFSHYTYYDQCFDRLMGDEFSWINRESWVRMFDRWVPYPFQNNVRYLPKQAAFECIAGLVKAQHGKGNIPSAQAAKNFGEFIDAVFGEGIAKHFMRPYNFKVWAHPPEMMNKQWIGERVAVLDVERALRNMILGTDDFGWGPNNRFKFPLRGGTGEFYRRFGHALGLTKDDRETPASKIKLNKRVVSIDVDRKAVSFEDGSTDSYDVLISTMPVDVLCGKILRRERAEATTSQGAVGRQDPSLAEIVALAQQLRHSAGHMVGIGLRSRTPGAGTPDTKSWMYFPEDNCPFYRVTYLSNYSPCMTPDKDNFYSLLCETSASALKPVDRGAIIEETILGLERAGLLDAGERANIVSTWHYEAEYSYPTPTVDRDEILSRVIPWLEARGIYSRGRFGMWKYEVANTDHSLMQGVECINRLFLGEPETTIGMVYTITQDGRNAATHERPAHAGSGEKRLVEVKTMPRADVRDAGQAISEEARAVQTTNGRAPARHGAKHAASGPVESLVGDIDAGEVGEDEVGVTAR